MTESTLPLGLFIQPACLQHKYIRHPNSSHIFERPERLRAVLLGVAAAVARLEQAEERVRESLDSSNADDLSNLLSGLSIQSSFQQSRYLSIEQPPLAASPGQVLIHHPALQLAHSPPSPALLDGQAIPSSTYLRDLHKWASEAVESIKQTGCEIPSGLGLNQGDLYLAPGSVLAIEGAVQTVCQAIDKVCIHQPFSIPTVTVEPSTPPGPSSAASSGSSTSRTFNKAFCAIRPPGHHCGEDTPSGFCYVNNVVVGALHAYLEHDIERAIIIDFDLHHGNGTQALVMPLNEASHAEDLAVKAGKPPAGPIGKDGRRRKGWKGFYGSVHDIYSYPCEDGDLDLIKDASLSLAAHGQYIENIHLQPYTSEDDFYDRIYPKYSALLDKAKVFMDETGAEAGKTIVLISAGFDACEHEHQGMQRHDRRVPTSFFSRYTKDIVNFADRYTGGKVVSVLEGGYSDRALTSAAMGHVIGMLDERGQDEWWSEPSLVSIEKATKKKRTGRIAPLAPELTSQSHLVRTHALLGHFESVGLPLESAPTSVANTPQQPSARMTLRDRRKAGTHEEEVTPPPTVSRRGRGTGTPRGKAAAAPTTPLARVAVENSKIASPANTEDISMTPTGYAIKTIPQKASPKTPTQVLPAIPASQLPPLPPSTNTTPIGNLEKSGNSPDTPTVQRPKLPLNGAKSNAPETKPLVIEQHLAPKSGLTNADGGKIMLRFSRPSPLPPSEIPSLPSPITPLPPSHSHSQSNMYPHLPNFATSSMSPEHLSIEQRLTYREGSASSATSEDYLSAKSIPSEQDREKRETTQDSSVSDTGSGPRMPGGLK